MDNGSRKSGPPEEYGENTTYLMDSLFNPELVNQKVLEAFANRDFDYYFASLSCADRPTKLVELASALTDPEFWHFVRKFWTANCIEHGWASAKLFHLLLSERGSRETLMKPHEHEILKSLPAALTIYRGCATKDRFLGFSWTLNEEIARKRAVALDGGWEGFVVRGECEKKDIVAFFQAGGLNEEEVVIKPENVSNVKYRTAKLKVFEEQFRKARWRTYPQKRQKSAPYDKCTFNNTLARQDSRKDSSHFRLIRQLEK